MTLRSKIYYFYSNRLYDGPLRNRRGATWLHRKLAKLATFDLPKIQEEPKNVFSEEWDNLIILDACRHDLYEEVNGETESRITQGSHSREFMRKTFSEGEFSDVIYITANTHLSEELFEDIAGRDPDEVFHSVYYTHDTDWEGDDAVPPEAVVRDALTAEKLFPGKKKIVHFIQPHVPFKTSEEKYSWDEVGVGKIPEDQALREYRENLEYVMPHVEELVEKLEGKTIITSDHGNLVGEGDMYSHPAELDTRAVRKVPWDVRE